MIVFVGDLERALILLPEPYFRQGDIYGVAAELGFDRPIGQTIWTALIKRGMIVQSDKPLGNWKRRFYWQRTVR